MKLLNKCLDKPLSYDETYEDTIIPIDERIKLADDLRSMEDKFYKIFDLNPLPMAIHTIDDNILIDFNDAFLKIVGIKSKLDLIGKNTSETGLNLLKSEDKSYFLNQIKKNGKFENYYFTFRNMKGELLRGLVSGTIIELNNQKCLLSICQIVYRKCFFQLFNRNFIF